MSVQASGIAEQLMGRPGLTQIRVHELASELNVSTHQVQSFLEDLGKKVRGPSTVIGVSAAAKVRGRFRLAKSVSETGSDRNVAAITMSMDDTASTGAEPAAPTPLTGPAKGGSAPTIAGPKASATQSLFLPPVAPTSPAPLARSTGAFANPFALPSALSSDRPAPRTPTSPPPPRAVVNRVGPLPAVSPAAAEPEPNYDGMWQRRGFSRADQQEWMAGGMRAGEAELADRSRSAGIAPAELSNKLSGRTALQRLRDGEASTSVWARIREAEQQPRRAGTKLTGRFQLS